MWGGGGKGNKVPKASIATAPPEPVLVQLHFLVSTRDTLPWHPFSYIMWQSLRSLTLGPALPNSSLASDHTLLHTALTLAFLTHA